MGEAPGVAPRPHSGGGMRSAASDGLLGSPPRRCSPDGVESPPTRTWARWISWRPTPWRWAFTPGVQRLPHRRPAQESASSPSPAASTRRPPRGTPSTRLGGGERRPRRESEMRAGALRRTYR
jgi:hypothetical protein